MLSQDPEEWSRCKGHEVGVCQQCAQQQRASGEPEQGGRWGREVVLGRTGDMGLVSTGKNRPFVGWDNKLLKGLIWLIVIKITLTALWGTDCRGQRWNLGAQWGAVVILQQRNNGDSAAEVVTMEGWEVVWFWIISEGRGFRIFWVKECKRKRGIKIFGLSSWKNMVALNSKREEEWMLLEGTFKGDLDQPPCL